MPLLTRERVYQMASLNKQCYFCGGNDYSCIHQGTRDLPEVDVIMCKGCGLITLSSFDHIVDNFYHDSKMHNETMEEWIKDTDKDDYRRSHQIRKYCHTSQMRVLDFGAGNCNFLMKIRDSYPSYRLWAVEPEEWVWNHLALSIVDHGINYCGSLAEVDNSWPCNTKFDLITMFHTIEHLPDPIDTLVKLRDRLDDNGTLIIETPNADDALLTLYGCKSFEEFTYWSCHLYMFDDETLGEVAKRAGFTYEVKQIQRHSLANHLHWLSKGKPGGHELWGQMVNDDLNLAYSSMLAGIGKCDTLFATLRKA